MFLVFGAVSGASAMEFFVSSVTLCVIHKAIAWKNPLKSNHFPLKGPMWLN